MSGAGDIERAEAEARAARNQLTTALGDVRARLAPQALARAAGQRLADISGQARRTTIATVRRKPATVIGIGATLVTLIARRPIARLIGGIARRLRPPSPTKEPEHE